MTTLPAHTRTRGQVPGICDALPIIAGQHDLIVVDVIDCYGAIITTLQHHLPARNGRT